MTITSFVNPCQITKGQFQVNTIHLKWRIPSFSFLYALFYPLIKTRLNYDFEPLKFGFVCIKVFFFFFFKFKFYTLHYGPSSLILFSKWSGERCWPLAL